MVVKCLTCVYCAEKRAAALEREINSLLQQLEEVMKVRIVRAHYYGREMFDVCVLC